VVGQARRCLVSCPARFPFRRNSPPIPMAVEPKSVKPASPPASAALGWRAHSGWASQIALGGSLAAPTVLGRRRVELADRSLPGSVQPFHAARDLGPEAGERLVARCREA